MEMLKEAFEAAQANQPSLMGELTAMTREAVKDIRATVHESYFGQPEHGAEQGAPLNPTPRENYEQRHESEVTEPDLDMG